MAQFKVYIKPFDDTGEAYVEEWLDITSYCDMESFSSINQSIDNADYNVGVFSFDSLGLGIINTTGFFSDVGSDNTIFRRTRADSLIKITYIVSDPFIPGVSIPGIDYVATEVEVFRGLLNDESAAARMHSQTLSFQVLGLESMLSRSLVPSAATISNMDARASIYYALLESDISGVVTVLADNVQVGLDFTIDSFGDLEDKTVKEYLDDILLLTNSVLFIENGVIYVSPREPSTAIKNIFFGQSASDGVEDVIDIFDIRSGINKCFNFWTWKDSTALARNEQSIGTNKVRKKEPLSFEYVTTLATQQSILNILRDEFGLPKKEIILSVPLTYKNLELYFLDKVAIDYPPISYSTDGDLAIYGISKYAESIYPISLNTLVLSPTTEFKIMGRRIDTKFFNIEFNLREV